MTPPRGKALAFVVAAALALSGCGDDSEDAAAPAVSKDDPDYGELPGNDLSTVLEPTDPNKEDYKEILENVEEEAGELP